VMNISINNIVLELLLKSSILHTKLVNMTIISDILQNICLQHRIKNYHKNIRTSLSFTSKTIPISKHYNQNKRNITNILN